MTEEDTILLPVEVTRVNGGCATVRERIARETVLTVRLNGEEYADAVILAGMETEYAAGLLYTQGVISSAADILDIRLEGTTVNVTARPAPVRQHGVITCGLTVSRDDIFTCVKAILASPVFRETEAVHSAGLFLDGKEPLAITEDLGRHQALDKVIGAALLRGADFNRVVAASTGRQPKEMIVKCRNAGIPVIATKGVPTTLGVQLAEESGITIAGFVRGETMRVYSNPERIV